MKMRLTGTIRWAVSVSVALLLLVAAVPGQVFADPPYEGYTVDKLGNDVHSINGYVYKGSIDGHGTEYGPFNSPEDIFVADDHSIYIADTLNSRIVHLSADMKLIKIVGDTEGDGKLNEPKGVYVTTDGTIYAADTKNQRIAIFNNDGSFKQGFGKPDNPLLGSTFSYSPSKLLVDKRGYMFVASDGNTQGLIQIDPNGQFKGFYGANHIGFNLWRLLGKFILTDEQKARQKVVRPTEFSNAVQDEEGFIYTTSLGAELNQIKRLSPVGVDTLNNVPKRYGGRFDNGPFAVPSFLDVAVDRDGVISGLDLQSSKVYQYDKLGNFLFVFGGTGTQDGLFVTVAAMAQSPDGIIYVADKGRHRIDYFRTTPFADLVHEASRLYVDGRYKEAEGLWNQVLELNSNFDLAYLAIGKSLYKAEEYKEAMAYFKLANSRPDYSAAFKEYRKEYIREHFTIIFTLVIVLFFAVRYGLPYVIRRLKRMRADRGGSAKHFVQKEGVPHDHNV